ncbi:MAG: hypothetical protein ABEJ90_05205 [Halobacterium sp.]
MPDGSLTRSPGERMRADAVEDVLDEATAAEDAADREALARIYGRSRTVQRRELDRALRELESAGGLTDDQRETVAAMADAIVSSLVSVPARTLRRAADEDAEARRTVRRLFGPEE